jgi:hypothetical protein
MVRFILTYCVMSSNTNHFRVWHVIAT